MPLTTGTQISQMSLDRVTCKSCSAKCQRSHWRCSSHPVAFQSSFHQYFQTLLYSTIKKPARRPATPAWSAVIGNDRTFTLKIGMSPFLSGLIIPRVWGSELSHMERHMGWKRGRNIFFLLLLLFCCCCCCCEKQSINVCYRMSAYVRTYGCWQLQLRLRISPMCHRPLDNPPVTEVRLNLGLMNSIKFQG